jgi:hypothetical protein
MFLLDRVVFRAGRAIPMEQRPPCTVPFTPAAETAIEPASDLRGLINRWIVVAF